MARATSLLVGLLLPGLFALEAAAAEPTVTAIVGGTVVTPGAPAAADAVVLIQGDRILNVGPRSRVPIPAGAVRLEARGKWITPGLIDAHVHFFQSGGLYTRPDGFDFRKRVPYARELASIKASLPDTFARYLKSGITGVVDVGGPMWNFEVRELAARTELAPRVAVAGPLVSSVSREALDLGDPPIIRAASAEEARKLVRRLAERKPDLVKIWYVVTAQETVEKNRPMVRATIEEAHGLGFRVAVHATELTAAKAALAEGADILVHSVTDAPVDEEFLALARKRAAIYVPTLIVGENYGRVASQQHAFLPEELALANPQVTGTLFDLRHFSDDEISPRMKQRQAAGPPAPPRHPGPNLLAVFRAGITVAMGTDAGNIGTLPGPSIFREMVTMEKAGLTPLEVLATATSGGARALGREKELGQVAAGFLADLLVVDADPAKGTRNLARIHRVIKAGRVLRPDELAPDRPEDLVQRQLNAYNARDLEAFLACFAPEVTVRELDGRVKLKGLAALRKSYGKLFTDHPGLHAEVTKRMILGTRIVDEERVTGLGPAPLRAAAIYEVKQNRITGIWFLPDSPPGPNQF